MMVEMQAKKTGRQILAAVLAGVMLSAAPAYAAQSQATEKAGSAVSGTVKLQAEKEQTEGSQEMPGETDSEFSESEAESEIEATVDLDALKEAKNENGLKGLASDRVGCAAERCKQVPDGHLEIRLQR